MCVKDAENNYFDRKIRTQQKVCIHFTNKKIKEFVP